MYSRLNVLSSQKLPLVGSKFPENFWKERKLLNFFLMIHDFVHFLYEFLQQRRRTQFLDNLYCSQQLQLSKSELSLQPCLYLSLELSLQPFLYLSLELSLQPCIYLSLLHEGILAPPPLITDLVLYTTCISFNRIQSGNAPDCSKSDTASSETPSIVQHQNPEALGKTYMCMVLFQP